MKLSDINITVLHEHWIDMDAWQDELDANKAKLKLIKDACSQTLTLARPLYHGQPDHTTDVFSFKFIRKDRRPIDTRVWFNDIFHAIMKAQFGSVLVGRYESVFMSPNYSVAEIFGDLFYVFAPDQTKFMLYVGLDDTKQLQFALEASVKDYYKKYPEELLKLGFKGLTVQSLGDMMAMDHEKLQGKLAQQDGLISYLTAFYGKSFVYCENVAALAKYMDSDETQQAEIMASGVDTIMLVKVPVGGLNSNTWRHLCEQIQNA